MTKLPQIKLLINLARIDGDVAEKERNYIYTIGEANGIVKDVITSLFDKDHESIIPVYLNEEEKFDYIFSLVQLMKIDERLYKNEIQYCAKIISKLGYTQEAFFEMMLHINASSSPTSAESKALKELVAKYLS